MSGTYDPFQPADSVLDAFAQWLEEDAERREFDYWMDEWNRQTYEALTTHLQEQGGMEV